MLGRLMVALLLAPVSVRAMDLSPDNEALVRAIVEGRAVAAANNGYDAREYLLYAVPDARDVLPNQGSVDAVVLLTPIERLRHAAYLQATSDVTVAKSLFVPYEIGLRVFAHGTDSGDGALTQHFQDATLRIGTRMLPAARIERSPTSIGRYPFAARDRERSVGTVTYWFDATAIPELAEATALLSFRDAEGKAFELDVNFASRQ